MVCTLVAVKILNYRDSVYNCFCVPWQINRIRLYVLDIYISNKYKYLQQDVVASTGNDRYSGHGYSGIDRYSGTKTPDDAILFTVSGITAIVEQKFRKFQLKVIKDLFYFQKNKMYQNLFLFLEVKRTLHGSQKPKSLNLSKTIAANEVRIQF